MNIRLYDKELKQVLFEKEYALPKSQLNRTIEENTTSVDHFMGIGSYREICFEGVRIGYGNGKLSQKIMLGFESDFETIELHFSLKGGSAAYCSGFENTIDFHANSHNIIYANQMCGQIEWYEEHFQIFEVNLSPHFFHKYIPEDNELFDKFRNNIENRKSNYLNPKNGQINHQMYQIIHEIIHCNRGGLFKKMFLESKVIELLLLQLEQFNKINPSNLTIKKTDIDKMYSVREFLLNNMDSACSLIDLAHKVGTNEFILKKGFKELFGTSVFNFWNDAKLNQVKDLLLNKEMNISEVAQFIGYKNQRHFSSAFKKKFGMSPSQVI